MLLALGTDSGVYKVLLVAHILAVIVGIGGVTLNGLYAAQSRSRPGPTGRAVSEANFAVGKIAESVIYTIPVFGLLLVWAGDGAWELSQTWVWLSLVLFAVALGISHGVLVPGHRRINELLAEMEAGPPPAGGPPPQVAEIERLGKRQAAGGTTLNLVTVVFLVLMIWKPGA
jgi:uncharacterized membrane protein